MGWYPLTYTLMRGNKLCSTYLTIGQMFFSLQMGAWVVLHHVSYYSLAFHIRQLASYLKAKEETENHQDKPSRFVECSKNFNY